VQQPVEIETARGVTREGGEEIPIGEHGPAGPQRRQDRRFDAMPEIDRVQERILFDRERAKLLPHLEHWLDERGGRPSCRHDLVVLALQPALQQLPLRRLAGAIRAFKGNEEAA
jgi:hypothetical protein